MGSGHLNSAKGKHICATCTTRTVSFLDGALLNKMKKSADDPTVPAVI